MVFKRGQANYFNIFVKWFLKMGKRGTGKWFLKGDRQIIFKMKIGQANKMKMGTGKLWKNGDRQTILL